MRLVIVALASALAACSPYDDDLGATPFLCGPTEPRCPNGYRCLEDNGREVCFSDGSQSGDESCGDDGALEPNDTPDSATPVDLAAMTFTRRDLTICPGIDKDVFAVVLTATNQSIEITIERAPATLAVDAAITNTNGIPITTAEPDAASPATLRSRARNLPAGTYLVRVAGPGEPLAEHAYALTIAVSAATAVPTR